jgi:hypothetical protein
MTEKKETRTAPLGLRLFPSVKAALEKAAAADQRPVASMIEKILVSWLKANGYIK